MKKSFFWVTVISLLMLQAFKQAHTAPITLNVTVSDDVCQNGQWVYWFSLNGNEYNIEDSCYLHKGQHSFVMKKVVPDENDNMGSWLTFGKHGPLQAQLFLNKGENVTLFVNTKGIAKVEGSPETQDWYDIMAQLIETGKEVQPLRKTLKTTKDSLTRLHLTDRIRNLYNSTKLKSFKTIKTPKIFLIQLNTTHELSQKTIDSLVTAMKQRFPNDKRVQEYPRLPKSPPSTPHSDWVNQKYREIWAKRTGVKL